jgi:hypothetical protein
MPTVFMYSGLQTILAGVTGEITTIRPGTLRLYTNAITPTVEDDSTMYDECLLSGYSPIALMDLAFVTKRQSGAVTKTADILVYTFPSYAGPLVTIRGSYVTLDASAPAMYFASPFETPFEVPLIGGACQVALALSLRKLLVLPQ